MEDEMREEINEEVYNEIEEVVGADVHVPEDQIVKEEVIGETNPLDLEEINKGE